MAEQVSYDIRQVESLTLVSSANVAAASTQFVTGVVGSVPANELWMIETAGARITASDFDISALSGELIGVDPSSFLTKTAVPLFVNLLRDSVAGLSQGNVASGSPFQVTGPLNIFCTVAVTNSDAVNAIFTTVVFFVSFVRKRLVATISQAESYREAGRGRS